MKTSVVSYTFNDAPLLHGLLAEIPGWTRRPDEVVIVDDGSSQPFRLETPAREVPIRIVRNETNQGFTLTKHRGITSAQHEWILSLDCDSRVSPNYLEVCQDMLRQDAALGMVAGASRYDSGTDAMSRYQTLFGDNYHAGVHGLVDFIPGHAFALRRAAWDDAGGFGSHSRRVCEDHALCANLRRAGYGLFIHKGIFVRQIRKISRHAHCKRLWNWLREAIFAGLRANSPLEAQLAALFIPPLLQRLPIISRANDPDLLYPELLCLASHCLHALREAHVRGPELHDGRATPENFCAALFSRTQGYARLHALLRMDLAQLGFAEAVLAAGKGPSAPNASDARINWQPILEVFDMWEKAGILCALDQTVVPALLEEAAHVTPDFSAYAGM